MCCVRVFVVCDVCACVRACVCVCACVRACVRARASMLLVSMCCVFMRVYVYTSVSFAHVVTRVKIHEPPEIQIIRHSPADQNSCQLK